MSHFLSVFLLVIIFWWLHVIICNCAPLSSVVLSTAPAPSASFHQDYGQLHKHFTDKDGQLFTDKAKVLLAAATAWAWMCVLCSACVCVRERGGGWQREPLMYGHFWFWHLQVSLHGPICPMHLVLLQPWTVLFVWAMQSTVERIRRCSLCVLIQSHLSSSSCALHVSPSHPSCAPPTVPLCHFSPTFYPSSLLLSTHYKRWISTST